MKSIIKLSEIEGVYKKYANDLEAVKIKSHYEITNGTERLVIYNKSWIWYSSGSSGLGNESYPEGLNTFEEKIKFVFNVFVDSCNECAADYEYDKIMSWR